MEHVIIGVDPHKLRHLICSAHARGGGATAYRLAAVCTDGALLRPAALSSNGLVRICGRGYTNGYTAAKGRLGFCPKRPLTCCFPVGMTEFEPATP